jgi:hypothetical protein
MGTTLRIELPTGNTWRLEDVEEKLLLRDSLPGAHVFDRAADSLRTAKRSGMTMRALFPLALASSWLVNSLAVSPVLHRWSRPPQLDTWIALLETLERGECAPLDGFGSEPYLVEAASKVLALLVPDRVPLMPKEACMFVLGTTAAEGKSVFEPMVRWFAGETTRHADTLDDIARMHPTPLSGAQVLDRLLWFDSSEVAARGIRN